MSQFITRVELHNASYFDYEELHDAMTKNGFSRYITSKAGTKYHLPEAEYYITGSNISNVFANAKTAANTTGKKFGILVSGDSEIMFDGLTPA